MPHRVMVVDDDDEIRETIGDILTDEGHIALCFENGQKALIELRSGEPPCLVFSDLMMPVMDGWAVLRERASDPRLSDIPVVVITALGKEKLSDLRANKILAKPLRVEHVLDAVQEFC